MKLKDIIKNCIVESTTDMDLIKQEVFMKDHEFIRKWYKESPENIENLLNKLKDFKEFTKKIIRSMSRSMFGSIYKKDLIWIDIKIGHLESILKQKKINGPDFIRDDWK